MLPSAQQNSSSGLNKTSSKSRIMNSVRSAYAQNQSLNLSHQSVVNKKQDQNQTPAQEKINQNQALDTLDQVLTEIENKKPESLVSQPTQLSPVTPPPISSSLDQLDKDQSQLSVQSPDQSASPPVATPVPPTPSADEQLQAMAQAVPQVAMQQSDTLNPTQVTTSVKEQEAPVAKMEINTSTGASEIEPKKEMELPVEVESYVKQVVDHQNQIPEEIVIADDGASFSTKSYPSQPVVVLPITQEEEEQGSKKSPENSFRWLVEFSRKIMKVFSGAVIYKQEE